MATRKGIEMNSYSPAGSLQPVQTTYVTNWDLFERAAKARYGANIRVIKTPLTTKQVEDINFELLSIVSMEGPKETR